MRTVQFVDKGTGVAADRLFTGPDWLVEANTPADHDAIDVDPAAPPRLRTEEELPAEGKRLFAFVAVGRALQATRWAEDADAKLTAQERAQWRAYRQALRDLPGKAGFPDTDWPMPPAASTT